MYNKAFKNNKEGNIIQPLPSDDIFLSSVIQIPKHLNQIIEEGSSDNGDEPDVSLIHSVSSDEKSNNSNENGKKEINSIFDFENIELPREEEHGDYTIITDFKFETLSSNVKKQKSNSNKEKEIKKEKNKITTDSKTEKKKEIIKNKLKKEDIKNNIIINFEEKTDEEEEEELEDSFESWDLLKILVLNKAQNKSSIMGNFKHIISSIIFNYKFSNDKLNKNTIKYPIVLFDSKSDKYIDINNTLLSFLYMSYRSGFFSMKSLGLGDYTSDSGWGCMLRCCQMMLSRGLFKLKTKEYLTNNKNLLEIPKKEIIKIKKDILSLFYDGKINYDKIRSNLFLIPFFQKYQELADIKGIDTNIHEIIPPFSIYTLCYLEKCQGSYISDIRMIKGIIKINELLFDDIIIAHFDVFINKKNLFETFLLKSECKEKIINNSHIFYDSGKEYILKKPGLIFLTLRLGLQKIDESYIKTIPQIFCTIHNNIGFVSGKKNRAYYFIGVNGDQKIIFVDPHYNQKVEEFNENLSSYNIKDLYILNTKDLSGSITLGIAIYNIEDFKLLVDDLKKMNDIFPNLIIFK